MPPALDPDRASPFDPVRPLTSAAAMGEAPVGPVDDHALFFAGFILLLLTPSVNVPADKLERKGARGS